MLLIILIIILLVGWGGGLATKFGGNAIHTLLVIALILVCLRLAGVI